MGAFLALGAWASVVDARERRLPNGLLAAMALAALAFQFLRTWAPCLLPWFPLWAPLATVVPEPAVCLVGASLLTALALAAEVLWRRRAGAPAFGLGDIKLLGCWSLLSGPGLALVGLGLGSGVGALVAAARHQETFALGPWMNAACLAVCVVACGCPGLLCSF